MVSLRQYLMATNQGADILEASDRSSLEWAKVASEAEAENPRNDADNTPTGPVVSRGGKVRDYTKSRIHMKLTRRRAKLLGIPEHGTKGYVRKVTAAWEALPALTRQNYEAQIASEAFATTHRELVPVAD